jgi:hypothetical protein
MKAWPGCAAVDGPKENRAAIICEDGWEEWLLELLLDGSPCIPSGEEQVDPVQLTGSFWSCTAYNSLRSPCLKALESRVVQSRA